MSATVLVGSDREKSPEPLLLAAPRDNPACLLSCGLGGRQRATAALGTVDPCLPLRFVAAHIAIGELRSRLCAVTPRARI